MRLCTLSVRIDGWCLHYMSQYNTSRTSGYNVLVGKLNTIRKGE